MPVTLNLNLPVSPVVVEANVTVAPVTTTLTSPAVNDYIINDGSSAITFVVPGWTKVANVTFTMKPGEVNTVPFVVTALTYSTTSGTASFRFFGHQL
jgi:hypothetical protein